MGKGRLRGRFQAALLMVLAAACSDTGTPSGIDFGRAEGDGELGRWVHAGFYDRTYDLHLPPGLDGAGLRPLLIVLHGAGDTGHSFRARIAADAATDAAGFITVYPDGVAGAWGVGCGCTASELAGVDDVAFLQTLVHQLAGGLPVDTLQVYVAGYSQGGQLAQRYGCVSRTPPAGVVSVAALLIRYVADRCQPAAPFPVLVIHGDADPVMRYDGFGPGSSALSVAEGVSRWRDLFACEATAVETTVDDHNQDGTSVTRDRWGGCVQGASVQLDRVVGGGHTWPGATGPWPKSTGKLSRNLDATEEIIDVFSGPTLE